MKLADPPHAASDAPVSSGYKWTVVALLWFICFFNYADRQAITAVFSVLGKEYHLNNKELALIGSAFSWVYALSAPFAGPVADRYPRKWVILGGLYIWSLVTGFTALCGKLWQFVFVRGAEGLGETFYFPASMSLLSDYHGPATRSRAMSLHQTSVYAGTIGGSTFAGWMALHYNWKAPFVILGGCGILLGLVLMLLLREPRRNQAERAQAGEDVQAEEPPKIPMPVFLKELVKNPSAVMLLLAFFGANSVAAIFLVWMPTFLKNKFQLDLAKAAFSATIFVQLASMVGAMAGGFIADRLRKQKVGGRMLTQAIGAVLGAPFIFLCGYTHSILTVALAMTFFGFSKGIYDSNIWASLYDVIPASRRGAAVGLMNMVAWVGFSIAAYVIGVVTDAGTTMSAAISATAVIYIGVAVVLITAGLIFAPRDVQKNTQVSDVVL